MVLERGRVASYDLATVDLAKRKDWPAQVPWTVRWGPWGGFEVIEVWGKVKLESYNVNPLSPYTRPGTCSVEPVLLLWYYLVDTANPQ